MLSHEVSIALIVFLSILLIVTVYCFCKQLYNDSEGQVPLRQTLLDIQNNRIQRRATDQRIVRALDPISPDHNNVFQNIGSTYSNNRSEISENRKNLTSSDYENTSQNILQHNSEIGHIDSETTNAEIKDAGGSNVANSDI